jgi:hypothetical protein
MHRRRCRHFHNLRPAIILLAPSATILHSRHNRTNHNIHHSNTYAHPLLDVRIQLLNRMVLLCSQSWRRLLSERPNMCYRRFLSRRLSQQHTGTAGASTAYKRISHSITIVFG